MTDSKGPTDSLSDILGPELSAKIAPGKTPPAGGAPRPPPGPGGKGAGIAPIPIPKIAPPPPPPSLASGGATAPLPRPIPPAGPAGARPPASAGAPAPKAAPARTGAAGKAAAPAAGRGGSPLLASSPPGVADDAVSIGPGPIAGGSPIPASPAQPAFAPDPPQASAVAAAQAAFAPDPPQASAVAPAQPAFAPDPPQASAVAPAQPGPATASPGGGPPAARPPLPGGPPPVTAEIGMPPVDFAAAFGDPGAAPGEVPARPAAAASGPAPLEELELDANEEGAADDGEPAIERPSFGTYWRGLSLAGRSLFVLLPLVLLAGTVAGTLWLATRRAPGPVRSWRGFVTSPQPLSSGPAGGFPSSVTLERGEPVERLATVGALALVRDGSGRVGYLAQSGLQVARPAVTPDAGFTRCQRRAGELDATACERRGTEQLEACRAGCQAGDCGDRCAARFDDCKASCALPVDTAAAVGSEATPVAPGVTDTSAPAAADDAKASVTGEDDDRRVKGKKGKVKGKGKKAKRVKRNRRARP